MKQRKKDWKRWKRCALISDEHQLFVGQLTVPNMYIIVVPKWEKVEGR